ncbi:MAG: hypothetical protein ACM3VV_01930 [Deltaproteobacteria bacterium]
MSRLYIGKDEGDVVDVKSPTAISNGSIPPTGKLSWFVFLIKVSYCKRLWSITYCKASYLTKRTITIS